MPVMPPIGFSMTIPQKDLDALKKQLDKWQGAPLAIRTQKALQVGMKLFIPPLRTRAARHNQTGATTRGYGVRKLRATPGRSEIAVYKASSNTWYKHFPIVGTRRGVRADPYVDQVRLAYESQVVAFITAQIERLA